MAKLLQGEWEPNLRRLSPIDAPGQTSHSEEAWACESYRFGRFQVVPSARIIRCDGEKIDLGSRAFDLLVLLLKFQGSVVTTDEIFAHVWPAKFVEKGSIRLQIAQLRKALGEESNIIKNIPGRGYLFVGDAKKELGGVYAPTDEPIPSAAPALTNGSAVSIGQGQPCIVIIEDDDDTREALQGLLRSVGLRAALFPTVQAFINSPKPFPVGCLVLDVWLPGKNGLDFHAELAGMGLDAPVIFMSGHADVHMSVRAMKAGAIEFLTKPVRHHELLDAIHEAMSSSNVLVRAEQSPGPTLE